MKSFDLVWPGLLPLAGAIYLAALSLPALDQVHLNIVYPVVNSFTLTHDFLSLITGFHVIATLANLVSLISDVVRFPGSHN